MSKPRPTKEVCNFATKIALVQTVLMLILTSVAFGLPFNGAGIVNMKVSPGAENRKITAAIKAFAITVSGTVIDDAGQTIPGVNVIEKGTTNGTTTDISGKFTLEVQDENSVLVFSFIGYASQEVPVAAQTKLSITLQPDITVLNEVVVVGYGEQKKESVVGAISQTTNKELSRTGHVTDLKQALTGQIPGVVTITSSGEPGGTGRGESATNIFIRGQNTWNGGQPLILVDGVERNMSNIDVNQVETVSVLKDASATAVFGVKGANGVILITTKRGSTGKPQLSFSYNTTAKMLSKVPKTLDSYNAIMIRNEAIEREVVLNEPSWADYQPYDIVTRYRLPQDPEYVEIYPNVDWEEAMFRDLGLSHRATVDVRGGTAFVKYFGSLSYLHEGDMFKDYDNGKGYEPKFDFNRFNFRSNLDFTITKTTKLTVNLSGYYTQKYTNYAGGAGGFGGSGKADANMWNAIYAMPPDAFLPQYSDGRWGYSLSNRINPVAYTYNVGLRETREVQMNSDFALEQKLDFITKGLSAKATFSYDNSIISEGGIVQGSDINPFVQGAHVPVKVIYPDLYTGPEQDPSEYTDDLPILGRGQYDWAPIMWGITPEFIGPSNWSYSIPVTRRMTYQGQMNYGRGFGLHNVGALALVRREEYAHGSMFKNFREDWVFRATYDYDGRYLFEMNGAYNGSEQFGPGYRFEFFPSIGLGWFISNEKFFNVDWISRLKLRYSAGMVGDDRVSGGRWLYASQYSSGGLARLNALTQRNSPYTWYKESVIGNPDVHWEKALKNNLGVEIGLLDEMFSIGYDYFTEDRTDILLAGNQRNIPPMFGATPPSANLGHVKSFGHELELKFDNRKSRVHYWAAVALAHNENEIIERDDPPLEAAYLKAKGYPIGQTTSLISTGFYNNWDEIYASVPLESNDLSKLPGFYNLLDFNGDGVIKSSTDRAPLGYSQTPQNTLNLSVGADYKGFSVMVQLYGVSNVSRYVGHANFASNTNVVFEHVADYWSKDNQDATSFLPRWKTQGENIGDYYIFDGSYMRLRTAEIAYEFQKASLSSCRVFLNGNNLLFWSDMPDDLEQGSGGTYPTVKRVTLGVNITF